MTLKKIWTMRAAVLMLALVLITSCFVGGTFAKYVTSGTGSDTARVAKFGVEVTVTNNTMFKTEYTTDAYGTGITYSVKSSDDDKLVAPGTKEDGALTFSVTGRPEVAVNVKLDLVVAKDVFLKAGTYDDYTTADTTDTFDISDDYMPVVFKLENDGTECKTGTLKDIKDYLDGVSGDFDPNTSLSTQFGTYTLSWAWAFSGDDKADTLLGNLAAGTATVDNAKYSTDIEFTLTATVTQID